MENITSLLEDVIKGLIQDPSFKDLALFLCIFKSMFMTRDQYSTSDHQGGNLHDKSGSGKSCLLLLLEGVASLKKNLISWPEAQLDIVKSIVDFIVIDMVDLNFRKYCTEEGSRKINYGHCWLQNKYSMNGDEFEERASCVKSEHKEDTNVPVQQKSNSDLVISKECAVSIDILCQVMIDEWRETSCWTEGNSSTCSVGEMDYSLWHPLHKWLVKLYAVACLIVSHSADNQLHEQAAGLQNGLSQYVRKHATEREQLWIESFIKGELIDSEGSSLKEEFSSTVGEQKLLISFLLFFIHIVPVLPIIFVSLVKLNNDIIIIMHW